MKLFLKENQVFVYSALLLCIIVFAVFLISVHKNGGHFVYTFDDAYIHMAMAKNLAGEFVWGVSKYEFTSSSSSLLWTSLLAFFYYFFSASTIIPLLLNLILSIALLYIIFWILKNKGLHNKYIFLVLLFVVFLSPLPPLIFTGLEHVLHILVSILFIYFISESVSGGKKHYFLLSLLAMILPLIRYEGIVLVFASVVFLLINKRVVLSIYISIFSFLPIYAFGMVSISNGWSFFPNSMVLKGGFPDIMSLGDFFIFLGYLIGRLFDRTNIIIILILIALCTGIMFYYLIKHIKVDFYRNRGFVMTTLLILNIVLYIIYAGSGWSYRYQSFLIAIGVFVCAYLLIENKSYVTNLKSSVKYHIVKIVLSLTVFYFFCLGMILVWEIPVAAKNIYDQQYQMGKFIETFYNGNVIALNDIGTTNYFADIKCIDLWGLSNIEVSKKMRNGTYNEDYIRDITGKNNVVIAILYDSWFSEGDSTILPKEWVKVGEWKIQNNVIAGDDVVSFYAVKPGEEINLISNLKSYSKLLPADVIQSGKYLKQ